MRFHKCLAGVAALTVTLTGLAGLGGPASAAPPAAKAAVVTKAPLTVAKKVKYVFPVKASKVSVPKTHSGYPATDIFAACGKKFRATTSGVVLEVSRKDKYVKGKPDGPNNGGKFVSILGDDGVRYYGSHLSTVQAGIKKGVRVKAGQTLGRVGKTGNASNVCHVHYGISPPCKKTGDWKVRRGVVWPAKYLTSWRKGGQKSPAAAVKAWKKKHNCKA
ncbi:M23 family metallopeptidase [Actinoplanes sp. DH11]|uniref:M23 family metallopeptidase n=1 Tax=Actinoplanes sp. DH11 TaxID=2857011 RepID=UPI001E4F14CA|nr:M23 family metallopeptidase [Actinoplanes sp. DH11]